MLQTNPRRALLATALAGSFAGCQLAQLIAPAPPVQLVASPPLLEDSAVAGSPGTWNRDISLEAAGLEGISLHASTAVHSPWLTLRQTSASAPGTLSLSLAAASLGPGTYRDTVVVTPEGFDDQAAKIPVTLTVRASSIQLAFTVQPASGRAGSVISPAVQVTARDLSGKTVTGFTGAVAIALSENPGGAKLSGTTTVNATNGIARFSNLSIDRAGSGYTFRATSGLLGATSRTFDMTEKPVSGSRSTLVSSAASIAASDGTAVATLTVTARDEDGNPVPNASVTLVATGTANTFATPAGTTDPDGVLTTTFASTKAEVKTISATINAVEVTQVATVIVAPAAASMLAFTVQPSNGVLNVNIVPAIRVQARDPFGNVTPSFVSNITLSLGTDASPLDDATLRGTLTVRASSGVSTFSSVRLDRTGEGFTVIARSGSLTSATSQPFDIL